MLLVVPPAHRLASRRSIPVAELDGEDYVGFTEDLTIRREVDRWLKRSKVTVNVVHEFDNIENIKRAIEIGSGVALLPGPTVRQEVEAASLVALPLCNVELTRPLGIVHKRHKQLTHAVIKLIELLHQDPSSLSSPQPAATVAIVENGHSSNGHHVAHRNGDRRKKRV